MNGPNKPSASELAEKVLFLKPCAVIRIIVMPLQGTDRLYKISNNGGRVIKSQVLRNSDGEGMELTITPEKIFLTTGTQRFR